MTSRTPQCEVFWALLSSSESSGVTKDSKPPTFPSVGLHPHIWPKWGCDTKEGMGLGRGCGLGKMFFEEKVGSERKWGQGEDASSRDWVLGTKLMHLQHLDLGHSPLPP